VYYGGENKIYCSESGQGVPARPYGNADGAEGKVEGWEVTKLSMESLHSVLQISRAQHFKACSSIT